MRRSSGRACFKIRVLISGPALERPPAQGDEDRFCFFVPALTAGQGIIESYVDMAFIYVEIFEFLRFGFFERSTEMDTLLIKGPQEFQELAFITHSSALVCKAGFVLENLSDLLPNQFPYFSLLFAAWIFL